MNLQTLLSQNQVSIAFILLAVLSWLGVGAYVNLRFRRDLRDLQDRQGRFIALASHYLFSPMSIIQNAISLLLTKKDLPDTERAHLYEAIERGNQRLLITAGQLLLVDEILRNNLSLDTSVQNLSDLVSGAITFVDPFARHQKVEVRFTDQTREVQQARVDGRRLKQAFVAIIDNAVKFSVEGGMVQVVLSYDKGVFVLQVSDQGPGMPADLLHKVSEKFYRGGSVYAFDHEGLGLGLFIAKSIVSYHQGTLSIDSQPGQGTVVRIEFPNL